MRCMPRRMGGPCLKTPLLSSYASLTVSKVSHTIFRPDHNVLVLPTIQVRVQYLTTSLAQLLCFYLQSRLVSVVLHLHSPPPPHTHPLTHLYRQLYFA